MPDLWLGRIATLLLAGGIVMHYFALLERSQVIHTVPYNDLYGSMSLFAWLLGVTYLGLELFHRQRSVGAFVTLLLIVWIVLLAVVAPNEPPPPRHLREVPLFAFHVTLEHLGVRGFRAIVRFEPDLSRSRPVAAVARTGQRRSGAFPRSTCSTEWRAAASTSGLAALIWA